jgi:hypothetical protein
VVEALTQSQRVLARYANNEKTNTGDIPSIKAH